MQCHYDSRVNCMFPHDMMKVSSYIAKLKMVFYSYNVKETVYV